MIAANRNTESSNVTRRIKVVIVYRVLQRWRVPVFSRLAKIPDIDLTVIYCDDFEGGKVVSYQGDVDFPTNKLRSINFSFATSNGLAEIPLARGLWHALSVEKPDIIVCEGASNLANNIISFIFSKLKRVPILQWGLGEIKGRRRSLHRRLADTIFKFVERNSDGAIAYSSLGASYYERIGLPSEGIFTAVNVVDTASRMNELQAYCALHNLNLPSPRPPSFNVLYVGAIEPNKGVERLVRAFANFLQKTGSTDASLTIVGGGREINLLTQLIENLKVSNQIHLIGPVADGVAKYFYEASIFVLPGLGGLAVSDALIHGVPVIATTGDGCERDLIKDGLNGYFCESMTEEDLCQILLNLYADPDLLCRLRRGAQAFKHGPFGIEQYVDSLAQAIRSTIQ